MFSKVCFLALIAVAAARSTYNDLDNYTFDKFVQEFNLKFEPHEVEQRRSVFLAELARVKLHISQNLSWKEGVTKFSAMTSGEKKAFFGRNKNAAKATLKSAKSLPSDFVLKNVKDLPASMDWRDSDIVSAVKDQGHCGSCWAFASTAVIESHVAKESGLLFDLSVQQIAMCTSNPHHCGGDGGCTGATCALAFDYVTDSDGLYQEYQYAYTSYYGTNYDCALPTGNPVATIDGYVQLPSNNYTALMNAVAQVGPVAISVDASTWHSYDSGIFDGCNQVNPDINHGVVVVGYGTCPVTNQDYWLVRNSWSPAWGEHGYIKIARVDNEGERCGTDITPTDGIACDGDTTPVKVCGTCGILFDSVYPLNAKAF